MAVKLNSGIERANVLAKLYKLENSLSLIFYVLCLKNTILKVLSKDMNCPSILLWIKDVIIILNTFTSRKL